MAFSQNKAEREINIVQTLTNLYTDSFVNIEMVRQADLDMDNSATDDTYGGTLFSSWMYQTWARVGLTRMSPSPAGGGTWVGGPDLSSAPCGAASITGADRALGVAYKIPKIAAQQSKSFKFQYRRD